MQDNPDEFQFSNGLSVFEDKRWKPLKSFNENLDEIFGKSGIPLERILELSGEAGMGKTQLCFQLCSTVQLPRCLGGLGGKAVFLDTEGAFFAERIDQIASATKKNALEIMLALKRQGSLEESEFNEFSSRNFLNNILYKRLENIDSLTTAVENLGTLLQQEPEIRLIVLDSIAFHFRYMSDEENLAQREKRTSILAKICQLLNRAASQFKVAVIVTNHMTTKFTGISDEGFLAPALGESYSYFPTQRIVLLQHPVRSEFRIARLIKSSLTDNLTSGKHRQSTFCITSEGIRDVVESQELQGR